MLLEFAVVLRKRGDGGYIAERNKWSSKLKYMFSSPSTLLKFNLALCMVLYLLTLRLVVIHISSPKA